MSLENVISSSIVRQFSQKLIENLTVDVAIVGGGPSALVAALYLRKAGIHTAIFERKLSPGGGVWGGGMLFNEIVVQEDVLDILTEVNINALPLAENGYYTVDAVELASGLIYAAVHAGARIFNSVSVEDIIFKNERIGGLVINWTPVMRLGLMVDPLTVVSKIVLDATGHPSSVVNLAVNKAKVQLNTSTGGLIGERPMWVESGEVSAVESTGEYYPNLFACGMSSNNVAGGYRMGPIFGGMIKSGRKAAQLILERLNTNAREDLPV